MPHIYIDADACPVKEECYRVAKRYNLPVTLVANSWMNTPDDPSITFHQVGQGFDEADDWIVEHVQPNEIVVTTDIPLAAQCIAKGARALNPKGRIFTAESMGDALANREVASQMREHGMMTGGPAPFDKKDRSCFLQSLDTIIVASLKAR